MSDDSPLFSLLLFIENLNESKDFDIVALRTEASNAQIQQAFASKVFPALDKVVLSASDAGFAFVFIIYFLQLSSFSLPLSSSDRGILCSVLQLASSNQQR